MFQVATWWVAGSAACAVPSMVTRRTPSISPVSSTAAVRRNRPRFADGPAPACAAGSSMELLTIVLLSGFSVRGEWAWGVAGGRPGHRDDVVLVVLRM
jgi:hypothetical protein